MMIPLFCSSHPSSIPFVSLSVSKTYGHSPATPLEGSKKPKFCSTINGDFALKNKGQDIRRTASSKYLASASMKPMLRIRSFISFTIPLRLCKSSAYTDNTIMTLCVLSVSRRIS